MSTYFQSLLGGTHNEFPLSCHQEYETNDILDSVISEEEVQITLKSLKSNKATGIDGLPPVILFNNHLSL